MNVSNEINSVRVQICGEEHPIKGKASADYIRRLAHMIDEQMKDVLDKNPNLPRHRAAILVALNLADELEKLREEHKELLNLIEQV